MKPITYFTYYAQLFIALAILCMGSNLISQTTTNPDKSKICLNFSPYYKSGQSPARRTHIPPEQIRQGLNAIEPLCDCIRIFSSDTPLDTTAYMAKEMGFETVIAGVWLDRDTATNRIEIEAAIKLGKVGVVDKIIVGSETLLRGDLEPEELIEYMNWVKRELPHIPVATADVYGELLAHKEVMDSSQFIAYNAYPYWEAEKIECAIYNFHQAYERIQAVAGDKEIWVSETGHPTCGNSIGKAVPNLENMLTYLGDIRAWSQHHEVPVIYFEAFDEPWKFSRQNPQEECFGLLNYDPNLDSLIIKTGVDSLLCSPVSIDTLKWTCRFIGNEADTPRIHFTEVPVYGDRRGILQGFVEGIRPCDYQLVAYIKVANRWWVKPTFTQKTTRISCDGSFCIPVVTGGIDELATEYKVFLIENAYDPPGTGNQPRLPDSLYTDAITHTCVSRVPFDWAELHLNHTHGKRGDTISLPITVQNFQGVVSGKGGVKANRGLEILGIENSLDSVSVSYVNLSPEYLSFSFSTNEHPIELPDSTEILRLLVKIDTSLSYCRSLSFSEDSMSSQIVQQVEGLPQNISIRRGSATICPLVSPVFYFPPENTIHLGDTLSIPLYVNDFIQLRYLDMGLKTNGQVKFLGVEPDTSLGIIEVKELNDSSMHLNFASKDSLRLTLPNMTEFLKVKVTIPHELMGNDTLLLDEHISAWANQYRSSLFEFFVPVLFSDSLEFFDLVSVAPSLHTFSNMFPNPAKDNIYIEFEARRSEHADIRIFDTNGRLLREQDYWIQIGGNVLRLDSLDQLNPGILLIQVITDGGDAWVGKLRLF